MDHEGAMKHANVGAHDIVVVVFFRHGEIRLLLLCLGFCVTVYFVLVGFYELFFCGCVV